MTNSSFRSILWNQFGACIDMLENAMVMCPAVLWDSDKKFWYHAFHCLFYLDYYLTNEPESFHPPHPFTLSEFDPSGAMPDRVYTKEELLSYLDVCRVKCRTLIGTLTEDSANQRWVNAYKDYPMLEILLYNMRHVQHHAAQLNLILRQEIDDAPPWVSRTRHSMQ